MVRLGGKGTACAVVGLVAVALLGLLAPLFRPTAPLDAGRMNDQVGYVTTARWLAETGELRSHLVYPAFVENERCRLYMPGHYAALALAYAVGGDRPLVWRLPGLLSFVATGVLVFWIGRRAYGGLVGGAAAAAFLVFPSHPALAFTAMSEPTFALACVLAFALLLALPGGTRHRWIPLLLVLPFLFRETGALLLVPMLCVAAPRAATGPVRATVQATGGSALTLGLAYAWQAATGKQALPLGWLLERLPNYTDATAAGDAPAPGEAVGLMAAKIVRNAGRFGRRLRESLAGEWDPHLPEWEPTLPAFVIVLGLLSLGLGLARRPRDGFAAGSGLLVLLALVFVFAFHRPDANVAARHLLFAFPFAALGVLAGLRRGRVERVLAGGTLVLLLIVSVPWYVARWRAGPRPPSGAPTWVIEQARHDDGTLLISDAAIGLPYALEHFPVRWSFVPDNPETLRLVHERLGVGTLLLRDRHLVENLPPRDLAELGFVSSGRVGGFLVFRPAQANVR